MRIASKTAGIPIESRMYLMPWASLALYTTTTTTPCSSFVLWIVCSSRWVCNYQGVSLHIRNIQIHRRCPTAYPPTRKCVLKASKATRWNKNKKIKNKLTVFFLFFFCFLFFCGFHFGFFVCEFVVDVVAWSAQLVRLKHFLSGDQEWINNPLEMIIRTAPDDHPPLIWRGKKKLFHCNTLQQLEPLHNRPARVSYSRQFLYSLYSDGMHPNTHLSPSLTAFSYRSKSIGKTWFDANQISLS